MLGFSGQWRVANPQRSHRDQSIRPIGSSHQPYFIYVGRGFELASDPTPDVTRAAYQCGACRQFVGSKSYYTEQEDFSSRPQQPTVVQREFQREVQREVLKIPYRYCKTLLDSIREKKCPNCGAVVST